MWEMWKAVRTLQVLLISPFSTIFPPGPWYHFLTCKVQCISPREDLLVVPVQWFSTIHRVPEYLSLRRNWVPTLPPKLVCLPPWTQRGGVTLICGWGGVGGTNQFGRRTTGQKAWHSVYSVGSPHFTSIVPIFWNFLKIHFQRCTVLIKATAFEQLI